MHKYRLPFRPSKKIKRVVHNDSPAHEKYGQKHAIDFTMNEGTKILAARDGKVVLREARYSKNYRNLKYINKCNFILLAHTNNEFSMYGHLKWRSVFPKLGQFVKQGEVIGLSGNVGYSSGPHLHFHVQNEDGESKRVYFKRRGKKV